MKDCSLDLGLSPMTTSLPTLGCQKAPMGESTPGQKQITMFYNGQVFVCDMIELQARAMILLATREMQGKGASRLSNAALLALQSLICGPRGVSMKRSLQKFLQTRRKRSEAASPYNNNNRHP